MFKQHKLLKTKKVFFLCSYIVSPSLVCTVVSVFMSALFLPTARNSCAHCLCVCLVIHYENMPI